MKVYVPSFGLYGKIRRKRKEGEIVVVFPQVGLWGSFKEEELFASKEDYLQSTHKRKLKGKKRFGQKGEERPEQLRK